jgi:O-antigen/teichoic acid export membrane protein
MSRLGAPGVAASTIGSYGVVFGQALRTLVLARLLGPASFGVLNIANVAASFTPQSDIGSGRIGELKASEARGRGNLALSEHELIQAAGARMAPAILLGAVLAAVASVLAVTGAATTATVLCVAFVAVSAPLQAAWWAVLGWLRVHGEFRRVVHAQLGQVVLWLTVVPGAAYSLGLNGALFAMAVSFVPPVLVGARSAPLRKLLRPRWSAFRRLIRPGIPVWLIFATSFAFVNLDQVVAAAMLGTEATGIYAIGLLTASALLALSDGAAAAAHPKTLEEFARAGRLPRGLPSVVTVMHIVQAAFAVLVPAAWIAMAVLTSIFLTQYRTALPVVALLGAAATLEGVTTASNSALLAVGRHRYVPALLVAATVVRVALAILLVRLGMGVLGIAAAALMASFVYAAAYLTLVARAFTLHGRQLVNFLADHLLGSTVLCVLAAVAVVSYNKGGARGMVETSVIALMVAVAVQGAATLVRLRTSRAGRPASMFFRPR